MPTDIKKEKEVRIRVPCERAAGGRRAGAVRGGGAHAALPAPRARARRHPRRGAPHPEEQDDTGAPGSVRRCGPALVRVCYLFVLIVVLGTYYAKNFGVG